MTIFRHMSNYIPSITDGYWITNDGCVYTELSRKYRISKRENGIKKEISLRTRIKKELKNMDEKGLRYTKLTIDGFNQELVLLFDGTLLKKLRGYIEGTNKYNVHDLKTTNGEFKTFRDHIIIFNCFVRTKLDNEEIHHINHNSFDNSIGNLIAMNESDHAKYHMFNRHNNIEESNKILNKYGGLNNG